MAQSLRHVKSRIKSIESTKKVTRAMEMISIAKLRQTQNLIGGSSLYVAKIESLLKRILGRAENLCHPLIASRKETGKIGLCLIASDTGLCGSYNLNMFRAVDQFLIAHGKENVFVIPVGRKAGSYFRKQRCEGLDAFIGFNGRYTNDRRDQILKTLMDLFLQEKVGEVHLIYTRMESASRNRVITEKFLNLENPGGPEEDYLAEPDIAAILDELVPVYLANKMRVVLLSAFMAEHSARSMAMGEATKNATDLLQALIMYRNKIRQASITNEVIEIISSAEALRG